MTDLWRALVLCVAVVLGVQGAPLTEACCDDCAEEGAATEEQGDPEGPCCPGECGPARICSCCAASPPVVAMTPIRVEAPSAAAPGRPGVRGRAVLSGGVRPRVERPPRA